MVRQTGHAERAEAAILVCFTQRCKSCRCEVLMSPCRACFQRINVSGRRGCWTRSTSSTGTSTQQVRPATSGRSSCTSVLAADAQVRTLSQDTRRALGPMYSVRCGTVHPGATAVISTIQLGHEPGPQSDPGPREVMALSHEPGPTLLSISNHWDKPLLSAQKSWAA